jgi:hypothetical protein
LQVEVLRRLWVHKSYVRVPPQTRRAALNYSSYPLAMAEVLGIISAVISIIEVAERISKCAQIIWQKDEDRQRFLAEIDALKELANSLETRSELSGASGPSVAQPIPIGKTVAQLHTVLHALESKVPTSESQSLLQKWRWQHTKADVKELFELMERVKSTINIQLNQTNLCAHRHSGNLVTDSLMLIQCNQPIHSGPPTCAVEEDGISAQPS